eukprot:4135978-Prymnesium_polylepis.1
MAPPARGAAREGRGAGRARLGGRGWEGAVGRRCVRECTGGAREEELAGMCGRRGAWPAARRCVAMPQQGRGRAARARAPSSKVDHVTEERHVKEAVGRVAMAQPRAAVRQLAQRVQRRLAREERLLHSARGAAGSHAGVRASARARARARPWIRVTG